MMSPPAVETSTAPVNVVAELKFTTSLVVVTSPAVLMPPVLVKLTAPSEVMSPPTAIVTAVVPVKVTVPLLVVVTVLLSAIVPPVTTFNPAIAL